MAYEFNGEAYRQASSHQESWGRKLIDELALTGNERILDLGCGDGRLTAQLAELVPQGFVLGLDASKGMIDTALKLKKMNLSFELLDMSNISYSAEFDLIYSNAALHWVKDHRTLILKCLTALDSGGRLRFNFGGAGNCANLYTVLAETMRLAPFDTLFAGFEWPWYMPAVSEYRSLLAGCGLCNAHVWEENADKYFDNADAMIRWIDQPCIVPFLAYLPDSHKAAFRDIVVDKAISGARQADGRCFETFRRINVLAQKS